MKHLLRYIPLLFISFLTYCTTTEEGLDKAEVMKLSTDSIEAEALGSKETFSITSHCLWAAKVSYEGEATDWLKLSNNADIGSAEVTVTISENTAVEDRYATIEVGNARYNLASSIRVHQKAGEPFILLDQSEKEVAADGEVLEIIVNSNIDYTITSSESWAQTSIDSGSKGESKIAINIDNSPVIEPRSATITFLSKEHNTTATFSIMQQKLVPNIELDTEVVSSLAMGATSSVSVDSNISWEASCAADWVTITPTNGEKGLSNIMVKVDENAKTTVRETVIKVFNSEYKVEKQIAISQEAFGPTLSVNTETISAPVAGTTKNVTIEGNISWDASCTADWVTITPTSGEKGTSTIKVEVVSNTKTAVREAVIKVSNSEYKVEKQIAISQEAFGPVLSVSTESISAPVAGTTKSITVDGNISWEASCDADWVTLTPTKGNKGTSTLKIDVAANTKTVARDAVVTISNAVYDVEKQITISQAAFNPILNVGTEDIYASYEGATESISIEGNISWEASCDADWVIITPTMGDKGASTIEVVVTENFKTVARETTVKVFNAEYNLEKQITISQEAVPNNVILYTSSDEKVVEPNKTNAFGASIVSNTYKNGQGIMLFNAPVTSIGNDAFGYCSSLTSVTIPVSVTSIGSGAFCYCTSLKSVTIPDSVTSIGSFAFYYCTSLTSVTIGNSVTTIGQEAFYHCYSLTSVTISDSVTSIGEDAFFSCNKLTSVTIPDSVTEIGQEAFSYCYSLKSFYGKFASEDNRCLIVDGKLIAFAPGGLTEYTIPDSVTSIASCACSGCTSLTSVTIGESVTEIGYSAFRDCDSLTSVYCKPTTPPAGDYYMFSWNALGRKIYVPTASVEAYKSAEYWSGCASDIIGYEF